MKWWSRNIGALAGRHLVAAADLVGFGRNRRFFGAPRVLPPFEEVSALIGRWLETFGEPVHLIGHSMGGEIAIRVAAERPELVRSLILVNAAGIPFGVHPVEHVRAAAKPPYGGASIARVLVPDFLRAGPASVAVASTRVLLGDERDAMRALRLPVLLVWGENDPLVPLRYGEAMEREIEGARLVVIPRAAHVAMWDAPEEFNRVALEFIGEVEASAPHEPALPAFGWGIAGSTAGIAHRQAGRKRDLVLVHGLGMSSAYWAPFARAMFARGWNPIAPDLPGFGESVNLPAGGAAEHAHVLAKWANALGIRDAVWVGHSISCQAVAKLPPELVRAAVHIGPLWTRSRHPHLRFLPRLVLDVLREPLRLFRYVIPAYWRVGIWRWWTTWRRFARELVQDRQSCLSGQAGLPVLHLAGARDPLPDLECVTVPGAHACHFSHPEETAEAVSAWLRSTRSPSR